MMMYRPIMNMTASSTMTAWTIQCAFSNILTMSRFAASVVVVGAPSMSRDGDNTHPARRSNHPPEGHGVARARCEIGSAGTGRTRVQGYNVRGHAERRSFHPYGVRDSVVSVGSRMRGRERGGRGAVVEAPAREQRAPG